MYLKDEIIKEKLNEELYKKYLYYRNNYLMFDEELLSEYIKIIKEFAFKNNCHEYALIFNSLDNKLSYKYITFYTRKNNKVIEDLDINDLVNSEVDASSLENGGIRDVVSAKGHVSIDTHATPFIYQKVLYLPATFKSINDESLDNKTPLLNSIRELNKIIKKVFNRLGSNYEYITPFLGIEQEFYLINKDKYLKRKDLKYVNHALIGNIDIIQNNYLFNIKSKDNKILKNIATQVKKVNIIPKSQHCEVGQSQFEIAPLYTKQNQSIDQNLFLKKIIQDVCEKYDKISIYDEKPFIDLSGSGQHNNYSLINNQGENLLSPTSKHFLLTISAFILGIDKYGELLRLSSSSYSNERRLGQKEAPSSIVNISLNDEIIKYLKDPKTFNNNKIKIERNRTSPIAFLGDKIEFRTLGASIDSSLFNTCLNTILIEAFKEIDYMLMTGFNEEDIVKDIYFKHYQIIYNGNNYDLEFLKKNNNKLIKYHESLQYLLKYKDIFIKNNIMSLDELKVRINVLLSKYIKDYIKDFKVLNLTIQQDILLSLNNELKEISKINKVYLNDYNLDKIEFIKQISDKFHNYSLKIQEFLNSVEDNKDIEQKINTLLNCTILEEVRECYKKIENNIFNINISFPTLIEILLR